MSPLCVGDALFFHSNLLHCSSQNNGPNRRWALAIAYNRADNDPVIEHHHPKYTKLDKVRIFCLALNERISLRLYLGQNISCKNDNFITVCEETGIRNFFRH